LTPRDLAALNIYEGVENGLYDMRRRVIRHGSMRCNALVYIARSRGVGTPKPGYLELVVAAARASHLPQSYVRELMRWTSSGFHGTRAVSTGEIR
jgi:hypothetical protein